MLMWTVAESEPSSLDSFRVYVPASSSFTPVMMSVVRSSVVSMWKRPPAVTSMFFPPRDHWMSLASPEKAQVTVRTLPGSMLMSSGRASILGAEPGTHRT